MSLFGSFIGYIHIGNSDFGSIKVVISQYVDQLISENIIIIISIYFYLFWVCTTCLQVIRYSDLLQSYRSHYVQILQISQGPTITILYILEKVLIVKLKSWFELEDFFHEYKIVTKCASTENNISKFYGKLGIISCLNSILFEKITF